MRKKIIRSTKHLSKKKPHKGLLLTLKNNAGRNNQGRITVRHRGGGVKRRYRIIDFAQKKQNIPAKVISLEYDPYRTAFIMLLEYEDGEKRYALAPDRVKQGDTVMCAEKTDLKDGNRMKLENIPVGSSVHNIEFIPGSGGKIVRSAGSSAKVLAHEEKYSNLQMPSGEIRKILKNCFASIGSVSNSEWRYINIGKAGSSRLKGRRPAVRGTAMNPCDHPHGGGEGRQPIGLKYPKTPWGKHALGVKTRKRKKWTTKLIIQRRKKIKQ
ncbi:MAG: 50S ribosomal protein L2 [Candidatus Nealsonbacteria bacterium RIFOXYB1_FULL_40_15]|uniref:Large ribosomal subunit protein uL2 n=2 Tax=Candidatus Nealsoniibacteriota TaxID=1817911 RepID=A0A1G2EN34_9BACT|nr:MAG: 50S ribosomal protein L2 [Candidatus Nealsonbacteria bacterium RIFOXYC1_FULL_40_7]OGZ27820.1 MAG: 50S ribosomal protein L2 [Candidatus Nealsonbacteria bacterium RIFOXYB1_FULL_40_15]OGZ28928.1 MAG: 50S ribosomal protein L2 [Candidatus Nealsonbacteria bacterium RIFOXYD1_FULL_39_11]